MKKAFIILGFVTLFAFSGAGTALAVQSLDSAFLPKGLPTLTGKADEPDLTVDGARVFVTQRVLDIALGTAGVAATFFIVLSGFQLITSAGNDEKLTAAKKVITWAVVGLIGIILSYSIVSYVIKLSLLADDPSAAGDRARQTQESQAQQNAVDKQTNIDNAQSAAVDQSFADKKSSDAALDAAQNAAAEQAVQDAQTNKELNDAMNGLGGNGVVGKPGGVQVDLNAD